MPCVARMRPSALVISLSSPEYSVNRGTACLIQNIPYIYGSLLLTSQTSTRFSGRMRLSAQTVSLTAVTRKPEREQDLYPAAAACLPVSYSPYFLTDTRRFLSSNVPEGLLPPSVTSPK